MKIIFFGTPKFAVIILEKLLETVKISRNQWEIVGVVTQLDKPVGRRQALTPSPVKILAQKNEIPVLTPKSLSSPLRRLTSLRSEQAGHFSLPISDFAVLAAYGKIIPPSLLKQPKHGFLNIHPSLLPKYRGASPVQFALLNGEKKTGVTIIQMDEEMDHGPIMAQESLAITPNDTSESLTEKLAYLSAKLLIKTLTKIITTMRPHVVYPQDHSKATFTCLLKKEDGFIPLTTLKKALQGIEVKKGNLAMKQWNHRTLHNFIRALYPWPSAWTILPNGKRLKLLKSHLKRGKIFLDEVQFEGRKASSDSKFLQNFL